MRRAAVTAAAGPPGPREIGTGRGEDDTGLIGGVGRGGPPVPGAPRRTVPTPPPRRSATSPGPSSPHRGGAPRSRMRATGAPGPGCADGGPASVATGP